jgi:hypothetical protein
MKITYEVYRFYNKDGVLAEPFKKVEIDNSTHIGREIIDVFKDNNKLYVGACYIGCKITAIEE